MISERHTIEERRRRVRADRAWLSPPDPSTNQNTASKAQHQGTTTWFFEGNISLEWKSKSTAPLLWIHGKRTPLCSLPPPRIQILMLRAIIAGSGKSVLWHVVICHIHPRKLTLLISSAIIRDIMALQEVGQAIVAYFYFDFKDTNRQDLRNALRSLLTQLSVHSDSYCDILSDVHQAQNNGADKLSTKRMITCLKQMLALPDQGPVYIILDAIDECPNTSGVPSARQEVLDFLKDLVRVQLPGLHICVTSRPEIDILVTLEPLGFRPLSIHDQKGQKKDIEDYIRSFVYSNSSTTMKSWSDQEKDQVIDTLSERADGM